MFPTLIYYISLFRPDPPVSEAIFAITAIIIFWYTFETSAMKKAIVEQNDILIQPILFLSIDFTRFTTFDRHFFLTNEGNGPAFNIKIEDFELKDVQNNVSEGLGTYRIHPIFYLPKSSNKLYIKVFNLDGQNRIKINRNLGAYFNIETSDDVNFEILPKINYEDSQGNKYQSEMKISTLETKLLGITRLRVG